VASRFGRTGWAASAPVASTCRPPSSSPHAPHDPPAPPRDGADRRLGCVLPAPVVTRHGDSVPRFKLRTARRPDRKAQPAGASRHGNCIKLNWSDFKLVRQGRGGRTVNPSPDFGSAHDRGLSPGSNLADSESSPRRDHVPPSQRPGQLQARAGGSPILGRQAVVTLDPSTKPGGGLKSLRPALRVIPPNLFLGVCQCGRSRPGPGRSEASHGGDGTGKFACNRA
jgi:hypothetical protein